MVAESWFRSIWKTSRKHESGHGSEEIGVLAFEVASLMSKVVHLWQSLSDKQVSRLREEIVGSLGIKKLVSENNDFVVGLIRAEKIDSMVYIAKSVVRLAKKCRDPHLKGFENVFDELIKSSIDSYRWVFTWRKMDKKVKKMEQLISINASLYQEMEMLVDLEQTIKRMKSNVPEPDNLPEYQKKFVWKHQEVKYLRDGSLWNKTYDYVVCLLARSLFTIFIRINFVFGINQTNYSWDSQVIDSDFIHQCQSISTLFQSSVHPSENVSIPRFSSGPLGRFTTKPDPILKPEKSNNFYSGPLGGSSTIPDPISVKNRNLNFFSGPLEKPARKLVPVSAVNKLTKRIWNIRQKKSTPVEPFKGQKQAEITALTGILDEAKESNDPSSSSILGSRHKFLEGIPDTLGAAALSLHYANVIVVIEKLVASPHLIADDARDDLYNMLPANVRTSLREKLKPYSKSLGSSVCDAELAGEWNQAVTSILEWLAPLAHNTIKWQSERSFEQQSLISRTNVLLVQTLYFANQEDTEATITELLVGLNYLWRVGRELNARVVRECAGSKVSNEY